MKTAVVSWAIQQASIANSHFTSNLNLNRSLVIKLKYKQNQIQY